MAPPAVLPPDARLMQLIFGKTLTQCVSLVARLRLADALAAKPQSADELAAANGLNGEKLFRVLRLLAGVGVLTRDGADRFSLTEVGQLLRTDVPGNLSAIAQYMTDPWCWQPWKEFTHGVKTGEPIFERAFGEPVFGYLDQHPDEAATFNDGMTGFSRHVASAVIKAFDFSRFGTIVDVGGGHGSLLASILQNSPQVKGILFDAPPVVAGAGPVLGAAGVAGRCRVEGGNFFETVPAGGDLYVLKHIVHDWSDAKAITILHSVRKGITDKGTLLLVELIVPDEAGPSFSHLLDLEMMVICDGKERTESEFRSLLAAAGFRLTKITQTESPHALVEAVPV
jgi:hypothetical protein